MIFDLYAFRVSPAGLHEVVGPSLDEARARVAAAIAKDADGKIRQSLIDLGWTPPDPDWRDASIAIGEHAQTTRQELSTSGEPELTSCWEGQQWTPEQIAKFQGRRKNTIP